MHYSLRRWAKNLPNYLEKIVLRIKRDTMSKNVYTPLEILQYLPGGNLLKSIEFDQLREFTGILPRPTRIRAKHPTNPGYVTEIQIGRIQSRVFDDSVFTLEYLPHAGLLLKDRE